MPEVEAETAAVEAVTALVSDVCPVQLSCGRKPSLVVRPESDRANMGKEEGEVADPASAGQREIRAGICLRIAVLLHGLGRDEEALDFLDRVEAEAADSDAADEARELRSRWDK